MYFESNLSENPNVSRFDSFHILLMKTLDLVSSKTIQHSLPTNPTEISKFWEI